MLDISYSNTDSINTTDRNVMLFAKINITSFQYFSSEILILFSTWYGVYKRAQSCNFVHSSFSIVQFIVYTAQPSTFFKMLKTLILLSQVVLFCVSVNAFINFVLITFHLSKETFKYNYNLRFSQQFLKSTFRNVYFVCGK